MTVPLIVLAVCTIVLSVVLTPAWPWLHGYLSGEPAHFQIGAVDPADAFHFARTRRRRHRTWLVDLSESRRKSIRSRNAQPACFAFSKTKCGWMNFTRKPSSRWRAMLSRVSPTGWIVTSGTAWCARSAGVGQLLGILTQRFRRTRHQRRRRRRRDRRHAVSGVRCPRWHSGQIQTYLGAIAVGMLALLLLYAWLDMITALILLPLARRALRERRAIELRPRDRSRIQRAHRDCRLRASGETSTPRLPACNWWNATRGFPRSAPNISSESMA